MRKTFQDITPAKKKKASPKQALRRSKPVKTTPSKARKTKPPKPREPITYHSLDEGHDGSRWGLWGIAFISVVILFVALSLLFYGAKVTVSPKTGEFVLEDTFIALKDASAGELSFEVMAVSGEETTVIPASDIKDIERKAVGAVIIYNAYSSKPQKLLIDTRLETPDGKIYKTDSSRTVPGATIEEGETVPGSIEVAVHADLPGEEYNIGLSDFAILGFKGSPKYTKFYARSKAEMTGGLRGQMYILSEDEGLQAQEGLREILRGKLLKQVSSQVPSGFISYNDIIYVTTSDTGFFESLDSSVPVTEKGTLYTFIFDERELAKSIAETVVSQFDGSPMIIPNLRDLDFALKNKEQISPDQDKEISFTLSGQARIIWDIDEEKLISDLLGKHKRNFQNILTNYTNISSAEVVIRPFWKKTFPEEAKDIKVVNTVNSE